MVRRSVSFTFVAGGCRPCGQQKIKLLLGVFGLPISSPPLAQAKHVFPVNLHIWPMWVRDHGFPPQHSDTQAVRRVCRNLRGLRFLLREGVAGTLARSRRQLGRTLANEALPMCPLRHHPHAQDHQFRGFVGSIPMWPSISFGVSLCELDASCASDLVRISSKTHAAEHARCASSCVVSVERGRAVCPYRVVFPRAGAAIASDAMKFRGLRGLVLLLVFGDTTASRCSASGSTVSCGCGVSGQSMCCFMLCGV